MKILLLNIDSKLPNLALKKVELWHKQQGDEVIWDMPIMLNCVDKAYASCIFTKNENKVDNYLGMRPGLIAGGTGFNLHIKLSPEIDAMKPHINYGFTTRGCIRKCPFCIVPQAEGYIRTTGDVYDLWDGKANAVVLLDNNILAVPEHFEMVCKQLIKEKLRVDFNQGLDIRLVNKENAYYLARLKYKKQLRFSFDELAMESQFKWGMAILDKAGLNLGRIMVFLLVGFDSTLETDMERLNIVKSFGATPFIMKYQEVNGVKPKVNRNVKELLEFARWVNLPHGFYKVIPFERWLEIRDMHDIERSRQQVML